MAISATTRAAIAGAKRRFASEMTATELKAARHALGLSAEGFAKLVRVESGRTVRRWEAGDRDIPGPVVVIVDALLASRSVRRHFGVGLDGDSTLTNG